MNIDGRRIYYLADSDLQSVRVCEIIEDGTHAFLGRIPAENGRFEKDDLVRLVKETE